jgi:hypothetical protein
VATVVVSAVVVVAHVAGTGGHNGYSLGRSRHGAYGRPPPSRTGTGCSPPVPVTGVPGRRGWLHGPGSPPGRLGT